jgi:type I restriction enzyme S subunit
LLVLDAHVPAAFESNMMRMRLNDRVRPDYVQLFLASDLGRRKLTADAKWAVNQASINQRDVCRTVLPVPSLDIQSCVVGHIRTAMSRLKKIAAEYAHTNRLLPKLDESFLAKAFRGEIVPQDPDDEPAEKLLERIRAARDEQPKIRRSRTTKATAA